jgi:hypothetical protein
MWNQDFMLLGSTHVTIPITLFMYAYYSMASRSCQKPGPCFLPLPSLLSHKWLAMRVVIPSWIYWKLNYQTVLYWFLVVINFSWRWVNQRRKAFPFQEKVGILSQVDGNKETCYTGCQTRTTPSTWNTTLLETAKTPKKCYAQCGGISSQRWQLLSF